MPIKPNFTKNDIKSHFDRFLDTIQRRAIARMQMLGEMCVKHARSVPAEVGFTDQTGALRSSTGYKVYFNGIAVRENFKQVKGNISNSEARRRIKEGIEAGKKLCDDMADKSHKGVQLVVVAGMNYSTYLESKGRDVLSSAEQLAEREFPRMIDELKNNIAKSFRNKL